jgi:hypothetical protein
MGAVHFKPLFTPGDGSPESIGHDSILSKIIKTVYLVFSVLLTFVIIRIRTRVYCFIKICRVPLPIVTTKIRISDGSTHGIKLNFCLH